MSDRNGGEIAGFGMIAGVVLVCWVGSIVVKAANKLFDEIGRAMDALGEMILSLVGMLLAIAKVLLIVGLTAAAIALVVYLTHKYLMMIKRGTEIKREVDRKLETFEAGIENSMTDFKAKIGNHLVRMDRQLAEALAEPSPVPQKLEAPKAAAVAVTTTSPVPSKQPAVDDDVPPASQPF